MCRYIHDRDTDKNIAIDRYISIFKIFRKLLEEAI